MLESEETCVAERKGVAASVSVNRESVCWCTYSMWVSWDVWKHNIGGWAVRHEWVQQCVIHVCVVLLWFLIFHISCRESSLCPVCDSTLSPQQSCLIGALTAVSYHFVSEAFLGLRHSVWSLEIDWKALGQGGYLTVTVSGKENAEQRLNFIHKELKIWWK